MSNCKVCNKQYHACMSCGIENWEYDFCNINCLKSFLEEKEPAFLELIKKLTIEDCQLIRNLALFNDEFLEAITLLKEIEK